MRLFYSTLLMLALSLSAFAHDGKSPYGRRVTLHPQAGYVPKSVYLKVKPALKTLCRDNYIDLKPFNDALLVLGVQQFEKSFRDVAAPSQKANVNGRELTDLTVVYNLTYRNNVVMEDALAMLMSTGVLEYAEPQYIRKTFYTPNDPRLSNQPYLQRIGAYQAWDVTKGDTNVVVGIVDSGVNWPHQDLVGNIKFNYADPINGIDDDNDGYVDNFRGWDMVGPTFVASSNGDNNPNITSANSQHGTHVAGTAVASTDNGNGIAGVGFNCKILPVKASPDNNGQSIFRGYEGIVYSADHGASVINCSWGGPGFSLFEQDIITYATVNRDALVVAAAGNDNSIDDFYPASYEYVLSVASVSGTDRKSGFSNYNFNVGISVQGEQLLSTTFNNTYGMSSGTSMASPVIAGAAALIRSMNPTFTAEQTAQQIKVSADNHYGLNGGNALAGRLGSGRLNIFNGVTYRLPGLRRRNIQIVDGNDDYFTGGDTLSISGNFVNLLFPSTSGCKITLSLNNVLSTTQIVPGFNEAMVGVLGTNQVFNNAAQPFKLLLRPNIGRNATVNLRFTYTDSNGYNDFQVVSIKVNTTFLNISKNNISTTITSNGRMAYNGDGATEGIGFQFKGTQTAFEIGLMAGTSATKLPNSVRSEGTVYHNHFNPVLFQKEVIPATVANFDYLTSYNENNIGAASRNGVRIIQNTHAYTTPGDSDYVIAEFGVINTSAIPINNYFIGYFADFDISANGQQDKAGWVADKKMGYVYNSNPGGHYAGIRMLGSAEPNYYAIENDATNNPFIGVYDGYTDQEKYETMSSGVFRQDAGTGNPLGKDVSITLAAGPYSIMPGDTVWVAFALLGGNDLDQISRGGDSANVRYRVRPDVVTSSKNMDLKTDLSLYPNPSQGWLYPVGNAEAFDIQLVSADGKLALDAKQVSDKVNIRHLPNGIYQYTVKSADKVSKGRIVLNQ